MDDATLASILQLFVLLPNQMTFLKVFLSFILGIQYPRTARNDLFAQLLSNVTLNKILNVEKRHYDMLTKPTTTFFQ